MIQRVSDPFDDLVMDSNKSLKSIYKGSRRNGVRMAKRKKSLSRMSSRRNSVSKRVLSV